MIRQATDLEIEAFKIWNPEGTTVLVAEDEDLGIVGHTAFTEKDGDVFCHSSQVYVDSQFVFIALLLHARKMLKEKGYTKYSVHLADNVPPEVQEFWKRQKGMKMKIAIWEGDL